MQVMPYLGAPSKSRLFCQGMPGSYSLFCVWFVSISDPNPGCTWVSRRLIRGVLVQDMGMVGDRCPEFTLEK